MKSVTSWWRGRVRLAVRARIVLGCTDPGVSDAAGIDFRRRMRGSNNIVNQVGETVAPLIATGLSRTRT
jgi:hypothetical protein